MLDKIIQKRNIILIISAVLLATLWALTLIFGNGEDKITVLVLSLVLPLVSYGFMMLMSKVVLTGASLGYAKFIVCFFLIGGALGAVAFSVNFVTGFPNGLSPTLGGCLGLIVGALDGAKKI